MSRTAQRASRAIALATALLVGVPTAAIAAAKPTVTTGSAVKITPTTVQLKGTINPNGRRTTYLFHYGRTMLYGTSTPITGAGNGTRKITVRVDISGLAPARRYHYRLVARNSRGTSNGSNRSFRTTPQPLSLSLGASPNPVRFGSGTVLVGVLSGTGNAGRPIVLQQSAFPHTQGFTQVGNALIANQQGVFAFTLLSVALNTQYRVLLPSKPTVVSPVVGVGVSPIVRTYLSSKRVFRGARVRFSGIVRPARRGTRVVIQRKRQKGGWAFVASTTSRKGTAAFSRYSRRVKIRRGGHFRVLVDSADGNYVPSAGPSKRIRLRR